MVNEKLKFVKQDSKKNGTVTEREIQALRWICEQGVMTVDQLWRAVWWSEKSRGPRYAYHRVLFLERNRFLEKVKSPSHRKTYFRITPKGINLLADSRDEIHLIPQF